MTDESFAEDVAAELQLSLNEKAEELQAEIAELRTIAAELRSTDLVRSIPEEPGEFRVTAITASSSKRPAFSGMLYGAVGVAISMTFDGRDIIDVDRWTRTDIDIIDFVDSDLQIRWKRRELVTELMRATLESAEAREIILTDKPLTITRQEVLTRSDSYVAPTWDELLDQLDAFWSEHHRNTQPNDPGDPIVVGLATNRSDLLFSALIESSSDNWEFDEYPNLRAELTQLADTIDRIGPHRLLQHVLHQNERTLNYPYRVSALDRRWLPEELNALGIQGVSAQISATESVTHFEFPGHATEWTSEEIDTVVSRISAATFPERRTIPLPLWHAREECSFPRKLLDSYLKKVQDHMNTND